MSSHLTGLYSLILIIGFGPLFAQANEPGMSNLDRDVIAILSDKCFQCHGPDEATREAELRLDTFEGATTDLGGYAAIVPADVDNSFLLDRIEDEDDPMPPIDSKLALTPNEKQMLREWIESGAPYDAHWSFTPPMRPEVPAIDGVSNPIDAFVGQRLRDEGLAFSPETTPEKLIRRITLDLTGLPPTLLEVDEFVVDYERRGDAALEEHIDRLMASPRYGETMALPWLDAARFADTDGYQYDGPRHQWRWRDWVIGAYNSNMPFDQFTIEQLAGDLLPDATLDQHIATGFNRNHRYNSEAGLVVEEFLLENAVDRVDTTSTLWMGLTVGCARCHDHKYDPFSQREYYQLIAYFNSVPEAGRAIKNGNSEPTIVAPTAEQQLQLAEKQRVYQESLAALSPGERPQQGGILIDRKIALHYKLDVSPAEHATRRGNVTFESNALVLDGAAMLELGGQPKELPLRANTPFSISFWLRPDSLADCVILSRQNPGSTRPGVEVAISEGRLRFDLVTRWVAGTGRTTAREPLIEGEWVHVAITNDGSQSANGQLIYLNGERVDTEVTLNTNSNVGGVNQNRPLVIGGGIRPGAAKFTGAIRDVRLYKTNLWPEEIEILGATYGGPKRQRFSRIKMTDSYGAYVKAREDLERFRKTLPNVMVMKELAQPKPTFVRTRGVYHQLGERVERDVPRVFPAMDDAFPKDRLGFAMWLVSGEHPLTGRVAVNRYWQKLFGTGLVKTAEDFGVQGEPASHPELLDWLAIEFVEREWNVQEMLKLMMMSRTYRQRSLVTSELLELDPENRLLARASRLRLTGQAIRDQSLFASGLLVERIGGPSVSPYQPREMWAEMSMGMRYKQSQGDDLYRRSLYTIWKRTVAPPAMAVFDSADREACWVKRRETNTPLQALTLMNETGFVESARHLGERMLVEGDGDPIGFGFRLLTSRNSSERERRLLELALEEFRVEFAASPERATALLSIGESETSGDHDTVEWAALTALANLLLNLDEVITRE